MEPESLNRSHVFLAGLAILLLLFSACANSEVSQTSIPYASTLEGITITPGLGRDYHDQVYCTAEGVELTFDLSYPEVGEAPYPLVIYVHGGSWQEGDKRGGAGIVFKQSLLEAGFAFASINYRLSPEHTFPAQIQDVKCAVRFFRANAALLDLDAERIAALGGSAGAHLVALLGLTANQNLWEDSGGYQGISSQVAAVVDLFGPADMRGIAHPDYQDAFLGVFGEAVRSEEAMWEFSPLAYVSKDSPSFLIIHGNADQVVSLQQSVDLNDALQEVGAHSELIVVDGGGHSTDLFNEHAAPSEEELIGSLLAFLEEQLNH